MRSSKLIYLCSLWVECFYTLRVFNLYLGNQVGTPTNKELDKLFRTTELDARTEFHRKFFYCFQNKIKCSHNFF